MENKVVSTYFLREKAGIDSKTVRRLRENYNVEIETLGKLCSTLDCSLDDIAKFTKDNFGAKS